MKSKKQIAWVTVLATLLFSLFDYFGYNISARKGWVNEKFVNAYRITQFIVQIGIGIACYFLGGWIAVIGFTILWWTWVCDWMFYFIGEILGIYGRGYLASEPFGNVVTWAWWTPYGLVDLAINGMPFHQFRVIKWQVLAFQSFIGILLTIYIVLFIGKL